MHLGAKFLYQIETGNLTMSNYPLCINYLSFQRTNKKHLFWLVKSTLAIHVGAFINVVKSIKAFQNSWLYCCVSTVKVAP